MLTRTSVIFVTMTATATDAGTTQHIERKETTVSTGSDVFP
jgi:hypothetical protein